MLVVVVSVMVRCTEESLYNAARCYSCPFFPHSSSPPPLHKFSRVDLTRMAEEIVQGLRESEPDRQVLISIEPGLQVDGDPHLLRVALENLLANAWKFTSHAENACVEFIQSEQEGERIFMMRDNGAGFDMAYAGKVFGAFSACTIKANSPGPA